MFLKGAREVGELEATGKSINTHVIFGRKVCGLLVVNSPCFVGGEVVLCFDLSR